MGYTMFIMAPCRRRGMGSPPGNLEVYVEVHDWLINGAGFFE
jgi:hypothetical protein